MKRALLFLLSITSTNAMTKAQEISIELQENSNFQFRTGFTISKKIKNIELSWNEELRTKNSSAEIERLLSLFGAAYKLTNRVKVGYDFTYITIKNSTLWSNRYRQNVDFILSYPINNRWKLSVRERLWIMTNPSIESSAYQKRSNLALRSRAMAEYKISNTPLKLNSFLELSSILNAPSVIGNYLDRVRLYAGGRYALSKQSEIEFYYRIDYDINKRISDADPNEPILTQNKEYNSIVGFFYAYSF